MRKNNVTLNEVNSETISGLLIQELPAVKKPLMRNEIETIDGRAGSIVTKLGYDAYDRDMTIGLYGKFDIDEVIRFFNSDGKAIFSNEPDKVYDYMILNEINFERLARFRTATVTLHCQPYKHSAIERELTFTSKPAKVYNSGNVPAKPVLTITGTGTVTISINSVQVLTINFGTGTTITIDAERMEAYSGTTLKNRSVSGDYNNVELAEGLNSISWTGTVTSLKVDKYSRWL